MLEVIDAVSDPADHRRTGDDRFGLGYDGLRAWVIDGATDVTQVRAFPEAESDAGWFVDALSSVLRSPPHYQESFAAHLRRILSQIRKEARLCSAIPMHELSPFAVPSATMFLISVASRAARVRAWWLGDCVALYRDAQGGVTCIGSRPVADAEERRWSALAALSSDKMAVALREDRRNVLRSGKHSFNLLQASADFDFRQFSVPANAEFLLMTDGFYRLVHPFGIFDEASLFGNARNKGLRSLVLRLRAYEAQSRHPLCRIKRRDDATAVLLRLR